MSTDLQDERNERNEVSPKLLQLDRLAAYIRGDSDFYRPFPGPAWFTPSRMAVIHDKIRRVRGFMVAKVVSLDTAMEIERYYLSLLSRYQYTSWGGDIGVDYADRRTKDVSTPLSLQDWHKMLDFLSDRMFYWSRQHRVGVSQVEAMLRVWLLVRLYHKIRLESRSVRHAHNMRTTRSIGQGRKPGARSRKRRSSRSQRRGSAV